MSGPISAALFLYLSLSPALSAQDLHEPPRLDAAVPGARAEELPPETEPVLRIDGEPVSWGEYGRWLVRTVGERQAIEYVLDYFVVEREAARRQVELAPAAVESRVRRELELRIENAFHGRRQDWLDELARTGRTQDGVQAERGIEARRELLASAIAGLDRVVPEHKIVRPAQHERAEVRLDEVLLHRGVEQLRDGSAVLVAEQGAGSA